jgi:hypothetical protein
MRVFVLTKKTSDVGGSYPELVLSGCSPQANCNKTFLKSGIELFINLASTSNISLCQEAYMLEIAVILAMWSDIEPPTLKLVRLLQKKCTIAIVQRVCKVFRRNMTL